MKILFNLSMSILSLLFFASNAYSQDSIKYSERANGHNSPYRIPLNEILKSPDLYEGTPIQVVGYLNLDWESDAVYLNKNDFKTNQFKKALWVHVNQFKFANINKLKNHYVVIDAIFDANDHGHENLWGGALKSITSIRLYKKPN